MRFLIKILLSSFSVIVASWLLRGVEIEDYLTSLLVAFVLAILNMILKPILVFLTIPITILTFGLFLLIINAVIALVASDIVPGFHIAGFWWAVAFSIIVSLLNYLINIENTNQYRQIR
jgi:putative membrane protein